MAYNQENFLGLKKQKSTQGRFFGKDLTNIEEPHMPKIKRKKSQNNRLEDFDQKLKNMSLSRLTPDFKDRGDKENMTQELNVNDIKGVKELMRRQIMTKGGLNKKKKVKREKSVEHLLVE